MTASRWKSLNCILDKELNIQDLNLGVPLSGPSCGGYKQNCCGVNWIPISILSYSYQNYFYE